MIGIGDDDCSRSERVSKMICRREVGKKDVKIIKRGKIFMFR